MTQKQLAIAMLMAFGFVMQSAWGMDQDVDEYAQTSGRKAKVLPHKTFATKEEYEEHNNTIREQCTKQNKDYTNTKGNLALEQYKEYHGCKQTAYRVMKSGYLHYPSAIFLGSFFKQAASDLFAKMPYGEIMQLFVGVGLGALGEWSRRVVNKKNMKYDTQEKDKKNWKDALLIQVERGAAWAATVTAASCLAKPVTKVPVLSGGMELVNGVAKDMLKSGARALTNTAYNAKDLNLGVAGIAGAGMLGVPYAIKKCTEIKKSFGSSTDLN